MGQIWIRNVCHSGLEPESLRPRFVDLSPSKLRINVFFKSIKNIKYPKDIAFFLRTLPLPPPVKRFFKIRKKHKGGGSFITPTRPPFGYYT